MELISVLDENFELSGIVDVFESLIWTTRYKEAGEFELYTPATSEILTKLPLNYYLLEETFYDRIADRAHLMIIEGREIENDHIKITGRSLKSILERRVIWGQYVAKKDTNIQDLIETLIKDNITNPPLATRKIANFSFDKVSGDWGKIAEDTQYEGQSLYEIMSNLCEDFKIGYEIYLDFNDKCFHMRLISPVDHSYEQLDAPPVVFSSNFDNLKSSNFIENSTTLRNACFVSGERYSDDEADKFHQTATFGDDVSGLNRRELFVDASDIRHELDDGTIYGTATYQKMLEERGQSELNKNKFTEDYEGEIDASGGGYIFGKDYKIGDTVEIINDFDMSSKARVTEMVVSISSSGITAVPTFEAIEEDNT